MNSKSTIWSGLIVVLTVLAPVVAWAQGGSGIAGVVRDTTGAVLPGVTVEASSPALIGKARTVVTDGAGLYRIIDLRPGLPRCGNNSVATVVASIGGRNA